MRAATRLIDSMAPVALGVDDSPVSFTPARLASSPKKGLFARKRPEPPSVVPPRRLYLDGVEAFDLSWWCGTCPLIFQRLGGANRTLSSDQLQRTLNAGLDSIGEGVLATASALIPTGTYLPMLLEVHPWLVTPLGTGDYFSEEQVAHRGVVPFWGLPENPKVPYYRGSSWAASEHESLFEFLVPMVPPSWNDRSRVSHYEEEIGNGLRPTILALSVLDVTQPWDSDDEHAGLIHFVLDGHHKLEAAAQEGQPIGVLSLLTVDHGLARQEDLDRLLLALTTQPPQLR